MLKTTDGQNVDLSQGFVIGYYVKERCIVLMPSHSGNGRRIRWPNGDDKRLAPRCVRNENDFYDVVQLIAAILGLRVENDTFERTYGPAYRLERVKE